MLGFNLIKMFQIVSYMDFEVTHIQRERNKVTDCLASRPRVSISLLLFSARQTFYSSFISDDVFVACHFLGYVGLVFENSFVNFLILFNNMLRGIDD